MTKRIRCKICGFKIRGPNHESGPHHNGDRQVVLATTSNDIEMRKKIAEIRLRQKSE